MRFRRRYPWVEACQVSDPDFEKWADENHCGFFFICGEGKKSQMVIPSSVHGVLIPKDDDWVIKGADGSFLLIADTTFHVIFISADELEHDRLCV